jgi:hydroxyethylthiazole kinase-like sugar kinase family protein
VNSSQTHLSQTHLEDLPFLRSLCWQSQQASIEGLSDLEILELYERNWQYKGVMADLSDIEAQFVQRLAQQYQSWLVNHV